MADQRPVVIGAGVVGCSIAHALARAGRPPIVVDRGPAAGAGSTSSSSAIVRFTYSTLDAVRLAWESKFRWEHWADFTGGQARFVRTGMLTLETPLTPFAAVRAHFDTVGVPYDVLDAGEVAKRFPALSTSRFGPPKRVDDPAFFAEPADPPLGAYVTPDAGFVDDPALAAHDLMNAAIAHGAEFRFHADVVAIERSNDHVCGVTFGDGSTIAASVVVNAAGPYSSLVNRLAGLPAAGIRTHPMRQEVHVVPATGPATLTGGLPVVADADLGTYFRPHFGDTVLVGGVEPDCDPLQWVDDPDTFDIHVSAEVWEAQTARLARRIPSLRVPLRPTGLAALYDVSDDWTPIYDRSDLGGFYLAIGTSGNQFKNAPMVGDLLAAIIDACEAGHDHDRDPVVVTGPETGQPISLAAFSRLRARHATTNSVLG